MKKMYEAMIAQYEQCCREYKSVCDGYASKLGILVRRDEEQRRLIALGECCGRWVNFQNPKLSATLHMHDGALDIIIYWGKSMQSATSVVFDGQGMCMTFSATAFMLPVRLFKEINGLMLGEYGLFLRDNDPMFSAGGEE